MRFSQEETSVDNLRALCLRWNKAAATFCAGSEYIDDPERVFNRIREPIQFAEKLTHQKGKLGLPYKRVERFVIRNGG